jgi:YggT family protein
VGDMNAGLALTADAVTVIGRFVTVFIYVYTLLIFAYIITSWIRLPYSLETVQRFLYDVCEPYIRIFRRIVPPLGPFDVSPIVAIAALVVVERVLNDVVFNHLH